MVISDLGTTNMFFSLLWVGIVPFGTVIAGCFYMKRIFAILLSILTIATFSLADDVTIDKDNCTITKDGRTYPLYGEVKFVETYGSADIVVKIVDAGSCDLEVKKLDSGTATSCGEWRVIENGSADLNVKLVTTGAADITVKFIEAGSCGLR